MRAEETSRWPFTCSAVNRRHTVQCTYTGQAAVQDNDKRLGPYDETSNARMLTDRWGVFRI